MSEASTNGINLLDPFGIWKTARDTNLEAWSKMMVDLVNSDEYSRTTGVAMEQVLAASQPFRDALERTMTQTLAMMNMPSRAEVVSLAERLVSVEMRLDDMDAKLTTVHKSLQAAIKDAVHQAATTPERQFKDVEAYLDQIKAKLDDLSKAIAPTPEKKPTGAQKSPSTEKA